MNTIARSVLKSFNENFPGRPRLFFSPGRINLIGEHLDYNDGFVLPAAIDKGVYYAICKNNTEKINFYSVDYKEHFSTNSHEIKRNEGWKNYVLSVINEFLILGKKIGGFDCVFGGDIPIGSGMSSSAAVEGGLAFGLNEIFSLGLGRKELALLCQRAEHNFPNVQCGIMDQFANMMGKKGSVILLDCRNIEHEYFPLLLSGYKIVLINSKVHHSLASGEYNIRRQRCEKGLSILKELLHIQSFRDINSVEELKAGKGRMEEKVYNCCRYVVEEISRTRKAAALLQLNDLIGFGKLMFATHEGLSKLYEVSCEELDFLVGQAKNYPAVIGSRLMGGGFGGCTINIMAEDRIDLFISQAGKAYQQRFNITPEAYNVEIWDRTNEITVTP
ncbi:MAG: galactokinase [Ferruginibacter sp.]